jgi:hypothetical protein
VKEITEETFDEEANEDKSTLLEPLDGSGVLVCRAVLPSDEMLLVHVVLLVKRAIPVGVLGVEEASEALEETPNPSDVTKPEKKQQNSENCLSAYTSSPYPLSSPIHIR